MATVATAADMKSVVLKIEGTEQGPSEDMKAQGIFRFRDGSVPAFMRF
jgi:hypothetical protein